MIDYFKDNDNTVEDDNEIEQEQFKKLEEDQQRHIQKLYDRGEIIDYKSDNEKANKKQRQHQSSSDNKSLITSEQEKDKNKILNEIQNLRKENPDLTFEQWSNTLNEKRQKLNDKINEYFPEISLELDFILSIKTILNIEDITLPFMGIVFAVPSSMKTKVIEILRKWHYSYFTDKFTPKSFVSHSATVAKDKLKDVDLLPRIKDKILLTPELSPLFTGKDEDIKEQFGIITRLLDGNGLETESGVHGKRGYHGDYMFTWIGAAVDIPSSVYKFLSTIGFKIYFLRLPRTEVTENELMEQLTSSKKFNEKMEEIEKLLMDYLIWFEICPISLGWNNDQAKIEWDAEKDDKDAIKIIAKLALLLAHIRGHVVVYKNTDYDDRLPIVEKHQQQQLTQRQGLEQQPPQQPNSDRKEIIYSQAFSHGVPIIENPSRANQQLYNLARGHALSYGRNYIIKDDLKLVIKVVLSTASIERVLILDLLIANKGTLTTSQITKSMNISNNTAKYTMTQFKGLELVTMERTITTINTSNSEYKITLNSKFHWFLTEEFANFRYEPAMRKKPLVCELKEKEGEGEQQKQQTEEESTTIKAVRFSPNGPFHFSAEEGERGKEDDTTPIADNTSTTTKPTTSTSIDGNLDSHKGENPHGKNNTAEIANNIQSDSNDPPLSSTFIALMPLQQSMESKIQAGLFTNPLISESDLSSGSYNSEVINNIDRVHPNSDRWFCYNCTLRDDKWGMMKHLCRHNKKTKKEKGAI
jgi:hypothetical protein